MFIAVQIAQGETKMLSSHGYEPRERPSVNTETQLTLYRDIVSLPRGSPLTSKIVWR